MSLSISKRNAPQITIGIADDEETYYAQTQDGKILSTSDNIVTVLNEMNPSIGGIGDSFQYGDSVVSFQPGHYWGAGTYSNTSKRGVRFEGNGAVIKEAKFSIGQTAVVSSQKAGFCSLHNFFFWGATAGVINESSLNTKLFECRFDSCDEALSVQSNVAWAEFLTLSDVHFNNCKKSLVFKTPTSTGTGSYINSLLLTTTFNSSTSFNPGAPYTFIEIQEGAQVNESKWFNLRLWFNSQYQQGIGIDLSGDAARCQLFKPYFENFGTAVNTIGIRYNASAVGGFFFVDRPVFAGAGTWTGKIINNSNKWMASEITTWRKTSQIAAVGTSSAYGAASTVIDSKTIAAAVKGMPNLHIYTTGIRTDEKITVEITINTFSTTAPVITKVIQASGWWPLSLADYVTALPNDYYYMIDTITARAHTNMTDTSGIAVYVGAVEGGTFVPSPSAEPFRTRNTGDAHFISYRPNSGVGTGNGNYFNMDNASNLEKTYARIYAIIDANTAGAHSGRLRFDCANAGAIAERFGIEKDGALTTKSYTDYTKISAPADPGAEIGRLYFKTKDASNNGLYVKLKIGGSIVEKEIAFV